MKIIRKLNNKISELEAQLRREPSTAEIADYAGMTEDTVQELLAKRQALASLDKPLGDTDGSGNTLGSVYPSRVNVEQQVMNEDLQAKRYSVIMNLMHRLLNPTQIDVVVSYFGIGDSDPEKVKTIAERHEISESYVRIIIRESLAKMKSRPGELVDYR